MTYNVMNPYCRKKTDQGKYNCPTSCAYEKENDGDNIWCFKAGAYKFDDKCSSSTPGSVVTNSKIRKNTKYIRFLKISRKMNTEYNQFMIND